MVEHLQRQGIRDHAVLQAMGSVPRELFVSKKSRSRSYNDSPLPIGYGQTISQPLIVAVMAAALELTASDRVLEIGTGSGYAAAVLAQLAAEVHSVERLSDLADQAKVHLQQTGIRNVSVHIGDGTLGWPAHAPFDAIVVAAGGPKVPPALVDQLCAGGRLVMPVGKDRNHQVLVRVHKSRDGAIDMEELSCVCFVPLVGEQGW